jgi:uncharacterized protein YcbX
MIIYCYIAIACKLSYFRSKNMEASVESFYDIEKMRNFGARKKNEEEEEESKTMLLPRIQLGSQPCKGCILTIRTQEL